MPQKRFEHISRRLLIADKYLHKQHEEGTILLFNPAISRLEPVSWYEDMGYEIIHIYDGDDSELPIVILKRPHHSI